MSVYIFLKGLFKRNKLLIIEILQANQISTFPTEQVINWFGFQIEGHPVIDFRGNKKQERLVKMICKWDQGVPRVLPWVLLISVSCQSQKPSRREPSLQKTQQVLKSLPKLQKKPWIGAESRYEHFQSSSQPRVSDQQMHLVMKLLSVCGSEGGALCSASSYQHSCDQHVLKPFNWELEQIFVIQGEGRTLILE